MPQQKNETYYDNNYFNKQVNVGRDNAENVIHFFKPHIKKNDTVLDFGCGGGFMLSTISCKNKIGFDINDEALSNAKTLGITAVNNLLNIEQLTIDVIISNSALEHTPTPFEDLKILYTCLKPGGKVVFRVPHETLRWGYAPNDWNYHLYTWSPMALGNLFNEVGFVNISVMIEASIRSPFYGLLRNLPILGNLGGKMYRIMRLIWEELGFRRVGVDGYSIIVADKPS
jgi:SAM-dependent methyltransferase